MRAYRQRSYVLFGIEVDRDVDATDIAAHCWPVTIEWEHSRVVLYDQER